MDMLKFHGLYIYTDCQSADTSHEKSLLAYAHLQDIGNPQNASDLSEIQDCYESIANNEQKAFFSLHSLPAKDLCRIDDSGVIRTYLAISATWAYCKLGKFNCAMSMLYALVMTNVAPVNTVKLGCVMGQVLELATIAQADTYDITVMVRHAGSRYVSYELIG